LAVFTLCESYAVSYICAFYDVDIVFQAVFLTAGVTLGLTVYAMTTKKDFTVSGGGLFMLLFAVGMIGLVNFIVPTNLMSNLLLLATSVIYGMYLIYDT